MTLSEILKKALNEETLPVNEKTGKRKRGILLLDIDDTLLQARDIFIWRKLPTDKAEVKLTPQQYADEHTTAETKKYYNYREFRDPVKVANSIKKGLPYVNNLKAMDSFVNGGYVIGVLTARGMEDVVYSALSDFLKYRGPDGNLKPVPINRKYVFAVNDDEKTYEGKTDYEKKKNVINKIRRYFDYVYFMDDDIKNLKAIKQLKKELPEKQAKKIKTITAKKPDNISEGYLVEMAMKDLEDESLISLLDQGKLKEAGHYYINKVIKENPARYQGLSWLESTQKILSYGIGKTVKTAVRKGLIKQDFADKLMKAVQLAGADEPEHEKEKREEAKKNAEAEKEAEKNEKIEKASRKFANYEAAIEKIKDEKTRVADVKRKFAVKYLDKGISKGYGKKAIDSMVKDFTDDLDWVMKDIVPEFITSKTLSLEARERAKEASEGEIMRERAAIASEYLNLYSMFLSRVISAYQLIAYDKELSDEEKEKQLATDKFFRKDFDKLVEVFKNRSKSIEKRKIQNRALKAVNKSDDDNKAATDTMTEYYSALRSLETAYSSGNLREFVKKNYENIRKMIQGSSYAVDTKEAKYEKPRGFDERPIQEEEDFRSKYGPKVAAIAKERDSGEYSYSGIERDKPELNYLYKYYMEGKGNPDKVFRILANIYLDFIDGINIVVSAKGKGLLKSKDDGKKKLKEITQKKEISDKMKKGGVIELSVQEVKNVINGTLSKITDDELKDRISMAVKTIDLDKESFETRNELVEASKRGGNVLFNALKDIPQVVSNISGENAKKLLSSIIGRFTTAQRFEHRIAVGINFNGNKFSQEELDQLAKAAFVDPTNVKLNQLLKDPKFATRKSK